MNHWQRTIIYTLGGCCLALSGCDCENKVRKALSDPGRRVQPSDRSDTDTVIAPTPGLPTSEPVEEEPNDKRKDATRQELSRELRPLHASLGGGDKEDWFMVGAAQDELLEVTVHPESETLDLELSIISSDDTALVYNLTLAGEDEVIPFARVSGGEPLVLRVKAKAGSGDYQLVHRRHMSAGALEAEPNDIWADAIPQHGGGTIQGFYDRPQDRDRFVLSAQTAPYGVALSGVDGVAQRLRVYLGDEMIWEGELDAGTGSLMIPNLAPQREWGVEVLPGDDKRFSRQKPYVVQFLSHKVSDAGMVVEVEPNDEMSETLSSMGGVGAEPLKIKGYLHDANDRDVMRLDVPELARIVRVKLQDKTGKASAKQGGLTLKVGLEGQVTAMPEGQENLELCHVLSASDRGGYLWLTVAHSGEARATTQVDSLLTMIERGEDYHLEVWSQQMDDAGDALELNGDDNSREKARALEFEGVDATSQGYLLADRDEDWYKFTLQEDSRVTFGVQSHPLDLMLELQDDEGAMIAEVQGAGEGGEERKEINLPPGEYFLKVSALSATSCEPYTVYVKIG